MRKFPLLLVLTALTLAGVLLAGCNYGRLPPDPQPTLPFPPTVPPPTPGQPAVAPPTALPGFFVRQLLPIAQKAPLPPLEQAVQEAPGLTLAVDPDLPPGVADRLALPEWLALAGQAQDASLLLTAAAGESQPVGRWVYALAAPFPTVTGELSAEQLRRMWNGNGGPFGNRPLLLAESTYRLWSAVWGAAGEGAVQVLPPEELLQAAWAGGSPALLPFEALEPRWKVLAVAGQSPIRVDFDPSAYPLSLPLTVTGAGELPGLVQADYGLGGEQPLLAGDNRQRERLTTVALTGVTALVRATAFTMEQRGATYPAQDVGALLAAADILHVSNEVPFARDCPYPNPVQTDLKFCSSPDYIELLEAIGTDVVELTGDHFADWGREAMDFTLELYEQRDWPVYGGGADLDSGRAPLTLEHNGNKIAFIGCNAKGGGFAQASAGNPGAVSCDFDYMQRQVRQLSEEGYQVIATFQHFEYYTYAAQPNQVADAHRLTEAGAAIVSGSQAHQPQGMEFDGRAFIHHGLGNLFFDQLEVSAATRQAFIDRHVFYDGRYISTELIPIVFVDFARPRFMDENEASELLGAVFSASGW